MEDSAIIALYWERDEAAITATDEKYGDYCGSIARNILGDPQAAEECVNDTWLSAWNTIPPQRPSKLAAFLGRITRNLSFDRYRNSRAAKRGGGGVSAILDELDECVSGGDSVERALERRELAEAIDTFLRAQPREKRKMFVCRYWYCDSVTDIAERLGMKPGAVSTALGRMRAALGRYLTERGFAI